MSIPTIFTYGNVELLNDTFNALAIFFSQMNLITGFVSLVSMYSLSVVTLNSMLGVNPSPFVKYLVINTAFAMAILFPHSDVKITDEVLKTSRIVRNVPMIPALFGSGFSTISHDLSKGLAAILTMPNDLDYNSTGMVFGSRMFAASKYLVINNKVFKANLEGFRESCVEPEEGLGIRIDPEGLNKANDIWTYVTKEPNPSLGMWWINSTTSVDSAANSITKINSGENIDCVEAVRRMNAAWPNEINNVASWFGNTFFPNMINSSFLSMPNMDLKQFKIGHYAAQEMKNKISLSYRGILGMHQDADSLIRQELLMNSFPRAGQNKIEKLNGTSFSSALAMAQQKTSFLTMGETAKSFSTSIHGFFQAFIYCSFMFVFFMFFFPSGVLLFKNYLKLIAWVESFPALYTLTNFYYTHKAISESQSIYQANGGLNMLTNLAIIENNQNIEALAGYMMLLMPFIALGFIKGGALAFANSAGSIGASLTQSSIATGSATASGNAQLFNTSMHTTSANMMSANKYDTNSLFAEGADTVQQPSGMMRTVQADGQAIYQGGAGRTASTFHNRLSYSQVGSSVISDMMNDERFIDINNNQSYTQAKEATESKAVDYAESLMVNEMNGMNHDWRAAGEYGKNISVAKDAVSHYGKYLNKSDATTLAAAGSLGLSFEQGFKEVAKGSGNLNLNLSQEDSLQVQYQNQLTANTSKSVQDNMHHLETFAKDQSHSTSNTNEERLSTAYQESIRVMETEQEAMSKSSGTRMNLGWSQQKIESYVASHEAGWEDNTLKRLQTIENPQTGRAYTENEAAQIMDSHDSRSFNVVEAAAKVDVLSSMESDSLISKEQFKSKMQEIYNDAHIKRVESSVEMKTDEFRGKQKEFNDNYQGLSENEIAAKVEGELSNINAEAKIEENRILDRHKKTAYSIKKNTSEDTEVFKFRKENQARHKELQENE